MPSRPPSAALLHRLGWLLGLSIAACSPRADRAPSEALREHAGGPARPAHCPERRAAPSTLPNTFPDLEQVSYWLKRSESAALDQPLLSPQEIEPHDVALRRGENGVTRIIDLTRNPTREEIESELSARLNAFGARFDAGEFVAEQEPEKHARMLKDDPRKMFSEARSLHVALAPVDLSCLPFATRVRSTTGNPRFDRNRCSQARAQEPVEVLGRYGGQYRVARTRYAWGFIPDDAPLSPPVPETLAESYRKGRELLLQEALRWGEDTLPPGTFLPRPEGIARGQSLALRSFVAHAAGFSEVSLSAAQATATPRPLTRRAFLEEAFAYMGSPYGWGDEGGGRDCSRFVVDVLARFGLHPPRTSGEQSRAGTYSLDIPPEANETERLGLLDAALERGVVLVHLPGHIMFYLGRDHLGVPRVLHSFAEYLEPCDGGGETLFEVGRVAVTDLSLGKNTSRRAFLERITRLTVFGRPPGHALLALTQFRAPLPPTDLSPPQCRDSTERALFTSPQRPRADAPLRVIAVTREESRPAGLWLVNPKGQLIAPSVHELGVGPYARWVEVQAPEPGRWTALLSDGDRVLACEHLRVAEKGKRTAPPPREPEAPAWQSRLSWGEDTENLYAAFVEQLFSQPEDELGSWASLTPLIRDPKYNLLYNHLGMDEDKRLALSPDCADLPYFLRAYFAWKMSLPFGYRQCSRGRAGTAPRCGELLTHEQPIAADDDVSAFERFARQRVGAGVHSASGRTLPGDEQTDLYPLPLTREALKPGTVFADPYGHVLVLAKWIPQGLAGAGMLIGADAQPDATVARRRFWRGNFLFSPETQDVGAGFKAFRPLVRNKESKAFEALDGQAIAAHRAFVAPSLAQYEASAEDFYARMDELIYPRPVSLNDRLQQLVSALFEQVERRVEAVDVGEAGLKKGISLPVAMPEGYAVFETTGAWEDFATPSRDMRLLIAIDAVRALPENVRARPERYGRSKEEAEAASREVSDALRIALAERRFTYTRSDGSPFELSLADVLARSEALEVGYNPNDCPEIRWGAPEGSDERATCKRTAPEAQRARMERYREWFRARKRPPRT